MSSVVYISILYGLVFLIAELLYLKGVQAYVTRKIVHIGSSVVTACLPLFVSLTTTVIIGFVATVILVWSKRVSVFKSVHDIDSSSVGALLYSPAVIVTSLLFWPINPIIFQGAVLILGLSDGFAGLVGKGFGGREYDFFGKKTLEGSLSFFVITVIIMYFFVFFALSGVSIEFMMRIILASAVVTLTEGVTGNGWDNVSVPIMAGTMLYYILW